MALTLADIKVYKAVNNSDTTANGGLITSNEVVDVVGAIFPNVDNAERLAGSTKWRKMFFKIVSTNSTPLIASRIYQDADTQGDDIILFTEGTSNDTQGNINTDAPLYAAGQLKSSVLAGVQTIDVAIPSFMNNWFQTGQTVRISDKLATDITGNEEFLTISNVNALGNIVTLTFTDVLAHGYIAANTRVMNVLDVGDIGAKAVNKVVTSAGGTFDLSKVTCINRSTVDATWTITFTSSSVFNITSSVIGTPSVGNLASEASITNNTYGYPYFTIDPAAFGGTFTSGDVISFQTVAATKAIWLKRIIPAGASPVAVNKAYFVLDGGSV